MSATISRAPAAARTEHPPGPAGHPLLGSLRELRADPLTLLRESGERYGNLVSFRAAHRRVYLVTGPNLIASIGVSNRDAYVKGVSYEALRVPMPDALLTADGATWRSRRSMMLPLFTRRALLDQIPVVSRAVGAFSERLDGFAASGQPFDAAVQMNRLAFDVIGRVLMGAALGQQMAQLEDLIDQASDWVARRTRALVPLPTWLPTPGNRRYSRAEKAVHAFADRLIAERRAAEDDDMVSHLVRARDEKGRQLGDLALRDEVIAFLMAGHQTTGAALAWTSWLLARHPDVRRRVADEAAEVLGDGAEVGPDELAALSYTEQVVAESMRLYPPGWAFTRSPVEDVELEGYTIRKGAVVIISSWANQRNPRFWDRPDEFDPDRFEKVRPNSGGAYRWFPFGIGPTTCIGHHLAMMELKIAVAMLARRYRFELLSDEIPVPCPAITLTPADPIPMRAHLAA